jgi:DNA helicase HerA-like ATPase
MQAHHTLVTGDSGGGKSTLLREMQFNFNGLSVWVNHDGADGLTGRGGRNATTVHSAAALRSASSPRINYRVSKDSLTDALAAARETAIQYREDTGYPAQVILDECQTEADEKLEPSHPLKRMLHEDRDKGVKTVLSTQDPSDLQKNYSMIKQCKLFAWVGEWSVFHDGFIRYFNIPRDELPTEPYRYVVFDKRMRVQYRGETSEEYS